jgi:NAD(P)H-hydrate epimerase
VTVATPASLAQTVDLGSLESMTLPLSADPDGGLSEGSGEEILEFSRGKQVLAVGPGLGTAPSSVRVIRSIVARAEIPVVLDADGLNAFVGATDELVDSEAGRVLTPHPGEMARLLGVTPAEVQRDRVASARAAASLMRSVVVLKGNQTLIADPAGTVFINPTGNPGMATGGTGDVLTGILTGLLSQGIEMTTAACLAVYVHGGAGDRALEERGPEGLSAGDLLEHLSDAFCQIRS